MIGVSEHHHYASWVCFQSFMKMPGHKEVRLQTSEGWIQEGHPTIKSCLNKFHLTHGCMAKSLSPSFNVCCLCWNGLDGLTGLAKPEGCTRLQSDLARSLQLGVLLNANHSEGEVGVFFNVPH